MNLQNNHSELRMTIVIGNVQSSVLYSSIQCLLSTVLYFRKKPSRIYKITVWVCQKHPYSQEPPWGPTQFRLAFLRPKRSRNDRATVCSFPCSDRYCTNRDRHRDTHSCVMEQSQRSKNKKREKKRLQPEPVHVVIEKMSFILMLMSLKTYKSHCFHKEKKKIAISTWCVVFLLTLHRSHFYNICYLLRKIGLQLACD